MRFDDLYWQSMDLKTDAQPLGDKLGFNWLAISLSGLPVSLWQKDMALQLSLQLKKDPYWHHGNTVVFFRAQQCLMKPTSPNRKSLVDGEVYSRRFLATKLFLVPSLNEACLKATGEHQAAFIQCLTPANLAKTFPKNTNPPLDGLTTDPRSHSMAHRYLPYIHNQILELAAPERPMSRKARRELFIREIGEAAAGYGNPDEVQRNRQFLAIQNMLPVALQRIQADEPGKNALLRFAAVTEEEVEFSY